VHLHSLDGVQHVFEGGSGSALVLLHGRVVGEYEGALAASGIKVTVGAAAQPVLDAATLLAGCPDRPVDMVAPDLTRKALPPGPYDVVAVLPDADGQLVTPPLRVQVTADPHALPTCGDVPVSTEPPQSRVSGELTGPAQAKAGSTVRLQVQLRSNQGKPEPLETGLPADVLVVRGGYVVGRTDGPVAGVGLDLTVPAQGTIPLLSEEDQRNPLLAADVTLAGCPQPSGHGTAVSASPRKPLPPGTYQLVAAIEDNGHGAPGVLVTQPLTVQVT
jgi:hypothetical protein